MGFTHFNDSGRARMVDVGQKDDTERVAKASCYIQMKKETLDAIIEGRMKKGDVLAVAQVGGIMASKKTYELIPMCHNILINGCDIDFEIDRENNKIHVTSTVKTRGKTGIEMEALTAVSVCALTIYDMCKAVDREMIISDIKLLEKDGGKSGHFIRRD